MSSTANARRSTPAQPAPTPGEVVPVTAGVSGLGALQTQVADGASGISAPAASRARAPRPWAAALQRPAAKILLAGGLTLAGWLLSGALAGGTAAAAESAGCPDAPAAVSADSTVDHAAKSLAHGKHRKAHRDTGAATCAQPPAADQTADRAATPPDSTAAAETTAPADEQTTAKDASNTESTKDTQTTAKDTSSTESTKDSGTTESTQDTTTTAEAPTAKDPTTKAAPTGGGLLGGLVGGVVNVVGGTLNTVTTTVGGTLDTVTTTLNTVTGTVLAPLTQPSANHPAAPVLLPLDDLLSPVLGGSSSGGVTAVVPGLLTGSGTQVTTTPAVAAEAVAADVPAVTTEPQTTRVVVARLVERQTSLPAKAAPDQPRDSGVHARDGDGDSTPGLPGGTSGPSAPATSVTSGHDGPGGARHSFAVHSDDVTTTQLKLIGASRDHDVDGAGREAALPTTSPD
ncbi:hypothetical protein [Amycolatopsis australiensis]|uniref:hypothetical protein n=1 Tax=Amycolatopsis australiensis TaxID=546364 RepID=UPI001FE345A0|nr:hypothetical protein [Amycolatopsis australiensis]